MKRVVVLAGVYFPNPSPTGLCAKRIVDILKDSFEVYVIFLKTSSADYSGTIIEGVHLYTVDSWRSTSHEIYSSINGKAESKLKKIIDSSAKFSLRGLGRLTSITNNSGPLSWYKGKALQVLATINAEKPISYLISVCSPFAAHLAAMEFHAEYRQITWVTYTVDPISEPDSSSGKRRGCAFIKRQRRSAEKMIYEQADHNLVSEEVFSEYNELFQNVQVKVTAVPYIIKPMDWKRSEERSGEQIILLYAGRFYRNLRNPEYLFRTFLLADDRRLVLHLYSTSDCEDLLKKYGRISDGRIKRFDTVPQEEIVLKMHNADILVSVGNNSDAFKPSKIFSYIASGKPVVHFYHGNARDSIFDKYPLALQLAQAENQILENSRKLQSFCAECKGKSIQAEEISRLYPSNSEEYFSELLSAAMSAGLNQKAAMPH
jgi:glycosyltransferase involved in cell wall biosynthesis